MEILFREELKKLAKGITLNKQDNNLTAQQKNLKIAEAKEDFKKRVLLDPGVSLADDGTITIDLSKAKNPFLLKSMIKNCGIKNIAPPEEIDEKLYNKLMTLAKDAPDGGVARKNYLTSLADRLGKNSPQYKAAVQRLDESIAHAQKLMTKGKVYKEEDWENHDIQRKIAAPNLANMENELNTENELNADDLKLGKKATADASHNGKYVNYSNTFFRDFYDILIKDSNRKDWFL